MYATATTNSSNYTQPSHIVSDLVYVKIFMSATGAALSKEMEREREGMFCMLALVTWALDAI